ncbi:MAG: phosphate starvation-inducible protein PhoH [Proteobacteria bacterium]|nr:phosphate starvation-inducible protein PhoH [Pseudomonadota bacterium]
MNSTNFTLIPPDNERLANLCGSLDENLREIEAAFNVTIMRRGGNFSLAGEQSKMELAKNTLQKFYQKAGKYLKIEDIQLDLMELANNPEKNPNNNSDEITLRTGKKDLRGRSVRQIKYLQQIQNSDVVFGIGPAGTGKTYLAVASAVDAFERGLIKRIILARPAVEAGERLGFLPGDLAQKVDPYLRPLYDALYDLMGIERTGKLFDRGVIEVAPLAYMRGRTINNSFVILDEAQNTTPEQMKMFLTRIGFGSQAVVTGDITQIDLPNPKKNGLLEAKKILKNVTGISFTEFQGNDVVRHPLVQRIVKAYQKYDDQRKN